MSSDTPPPGFSARIPAARPIYDIVSRWWTAKDAYGSILSTRPLWARKNVGMLHRVIAEGLPRGAGCAPDELYQALKGAPPETTQLAAEMLWIMLLFPADITPVEKVGRVMEVWSWSGEALSPAHPHLAPLNMGGLVDAGPPFGQHLWRELAFMVRLVEAWKAMEGGMNKAEIKINPLDFASWLDRIEGAETCRLRHILLHLRFPETFEPVPSAEQKRLITRVYAPLARVDRPGVGWSKLALLDARLLAVRHALQARNPEQRFDFYAPEVAHDWLPGARSEGGAGPGEADLALSASAARAVALAQALARARTDVRDGAHSLVVLVGVLAVSIAAGRDDFARAILVRLLPDTPPEGWMDEVRALLSRYGIPPSALAEGEAAPYAWGGDPVLDAIVAEGRVVSSEVSPEAGGEISLRHLLGVLLRPGSAYSAAPHLRDGGVDVPALRHEMLEFLRARPRYDDLEAWRRMMLGAVVEEPPSHPGYVTDDTEGEDQLSVTGDVNALATVLAAATVKPPVSVGLFGDWGSGKSFFMRRLERRIAELSARSRSARRAGQGSAYCTGVVQIWFNAWHYLDANLWASLVTRVFEGLAQALAPAGEEEGETRRRLFGELQANQAMLAEAEARREQARGEHQAMQERAAALGTRREGLRARLEDAARTAGALVRAVGEDEAVQPALRGAARALRLPEDRVAAEQVQARLLELRGFGGTLRESWALVRRQGSRAGQLAVAAAGAAVLAAGAYGAWRLGLADRLPAAIASVGAALASLVALLAPWMLLVGRGKRMLESADAQLGKLAAARRERLEREAADAHRELDRLEAAEAAARHEADAARQKVLDAEREIDEIRAGRRLERFINERSGSEDYRRHLGIVATIRADFERLSDLLHRVHDDDGGAPEVDRIILYIDDLDRCPEERVVEVLQAVHLLLAFPLFVVVVGVDSRWLLRAVQGRYAHQLAGAEGESGDGDQSDHRQATPQNYLEKIFQIPFSLRPMEDGGFGRLIGSLLPVRTDPAPTPVSLPLHPGSANGGAPVEDGAGDAAATAGAYPRSDSSADAGVAVPRVEAVSEDASPSETAWKPDRFTAPNVAVVDEPNPFERLAGLQVRNPAPVPAAAEDDPEMMPRSLEVEVWELDFLQRLSPFIASPRAAKRFVNIYRFLRAALPGEDLDRFRGTANEPGEYQACGLLLALLTGFPAEASHLFRRLVREGTGRPGGWWAFADAALAELPGAIADAEDAGLLPAARRWSRLATALQKVRPTLPLDDDLQPFLDWVPRVARFSFHTTPLDTRRSY
jgi:hypothetical protein